MAAQARDLKAQETEQIIDDYETSRNPTSKKLIEVFLFPPCLWITQMLVHTPWTHPHSFKDHEWQLKNKEMKTHPAGAPHEIQLPRYELLCSEAVASTLSCQHSLLHSSVSGPFWLKQLLKHSKAVGCFPFLAISPKRWCLHNLCKCLCSPPSWSGVSVPDCT